MSTSLEAPIDLTGDDDDFDNGSPNNPIYLSTPKLIPERRPLSHMSIPILAPSAVSIPQLHQPFSSSNSALFPHYSVGTFPSKQEPPADLFPPLPSHYIHQPPSYVSPPSVHSSDLSRESNVIDLTSSPSPPPQRLSFPPPSSQGPSRGAFYAPYTPIQQQQQHHHHHHHIQTPMASLQNPNLPPPIPATPQQLAQDPKRPACIGQLLSTALVLYPIPYLISPHPSNEEWAPVRLRCDVTSEDTKTISICTPPLRSHTGEALNGEQFGIVEAKIASILGPMMAKGLIRADAKVQKGKPDVPILPLQLLLFTPLGNIPVIGPHLFQSNILLNHPSHPFEVEKLGGNRIPYLNPHNPPAGGWAARSNSLQNRIQAPAVTNVKSVDMPRSQADAMFKNLRSGEELEETEPPEGTIGSTLYPHQKKALTFLLEREGERPGAGTLWQAKIDPLDGSVQGWVNSITNKTLESPGGGAPESNGPPNEKGSLLADDMGLGKTITTVSLIAATLNSAEQFAKQPIVPPTPPRHSAAGLTEQMDDMHIQNAVWMPGHVTTALSKKEQAKLKATEKAASSIFARESRIKVRSRATLIVCPLSTVSNWEEQFREHWAGEVMVIGGGTSNPDEKEKKESKTKKKDKVDEGQSTLSFWRKSSEGLVKLETMAMDDSRDVSLGLPRGASVTSSSSFLTASASTPAASCTPSPPSTKAETPENIPIDPASDTSRNKSKCKPLRVYIYHGNSRRPDPAYLADFDAVITTYATLASEYSRQLKSLSAQEDCGKEDNSKEAPDDFSECMMEGLQDDIDGILGTESVIRMTGGGSPRGKKFAPGSSSQVCGVKRKKLCPSAGGDGCPSDEQSSPLQRVWWFRVVLDEAHSIKETSTVASRASCDLYADRRLCLTGTPVQNKLDDVYALIKFLRVAPFDDKAVWTEFIGGPVKFGHSLGITRLQAVMKCLTLRRTKESKAEDGTNILTLPPRRDQVRMLQFDSHEKAIYDGFFQESKAEFNELSDKNEVMKNYVGILQKILRLRQICDHFELVQGKEFGFGSIEDVTRAIEREGLSLSSAAAVFGFLRESGTNQCVECGCELGPSEGGAEEEGLLVNGTAGSSSAGSSLCPPNKRARKMKMKTSTPAGTRPNSPTPAGAEPPYRIVLTKCQHLFCIGCFRHTVCSAWPGVGAEETRPCAACQSSLVPSRDAVEVTPAAAASLDKDKEEKKKIKKEKRVKGSAFGEDGGQAISFNPSTKIKALLNDLYESSKLNPYSANYDNQLLMVDADGKQSDDAVIKTVVFSQWTTMLDKIEEGLELFNIRFERLDGTMKREDRFRAMEELKHNKACEVLLVSLRAGGVGLNLTAAQRVYLMDPYWNPAVENQAVDRIHRLGQKKPVTTIKLIIENSIEARLLEVQKKKTALANMTLAGTVHTKAEIMQRRMEELNELFGS